MVGSNKLVQLVRSQAGPVCRIPKEDQWLRWPACLQYHSLVHSLLCAPGEAHSGQMRGSCDGVPKIWPRWGHKVADPWGKPRLLGYLEDKVVWEDRCARWLPHADVSHDRRGDAEIAPDGCEIEGCHGGYEPLEPPLFDTVPHVGGMRVRVNLREKRRNFSETRFEISTLLFMYPHISIFNSKSSNFFSVP